ncbi:MAG: helix-turn-helix transcriptional regulator [Anaerostipes sp.]|nr:helix-turn-helix transcriptional regulator [Anaerostipes sp.]
MSILSDRLVTYRETASLTQKEMAEKIGVPISKYVGWENGNEVYADDLLQITTATNVSCDYFAGNILFPLPPATEENNGLFYALFKKTDKEQLEIMRNIIERLEEESNKE